MEMIVDGDAVFAATGGQPFERERPSIVFGHGAGMDHTVWALQTRYFAYPELPDHPDHELAKKLLPRGSGAIFSFEINGGRAAGRRFIEGLRLFSHLANVGDAKSLVIHPASTTHQQMDAEALRVAGVSEGLVRLSVGLEDARDLIDDLSRGLRASQRP